MAKVLSTCTATIANGGTFGLMTPVHKVLDSVVSLTIYAPATLPETVTVYLGAGDSDNTVGNMRQAQVGGAAITTAAGKSYPLTLAGWRNLALVAGAAVGADRVFTIVLQLDTTD